MGDGETASEILEMGGREFPRLSRMQFSIVMHIEVRTALFSREAATQAIPHHTANIH